MLQRTPVQELFQTIDMSQINPVIESSFDLSQGQGQGGSGVSQQSSGFRPLSGMV